MPGPVEFKDRPRTPPCIPPPSRSEDDLVDTMFYYSPDAGAKILSTGIHEGEAINMQSESYLRAFRARSTRWAVCKAIDRYKEGLGEYVKYNYHLFIVPFGEKHRGQTVGEVCDNSWMRWTTSDEPEGRHGMRFKQPLIYEAMSNWMEHGGPLRFNDFTPQAVQKWDIPPLRDVKTEELVVKVENGQDYTSQRQPSIKTDSTNEYFMVVKKEEECDLEGMTFIKAEPLTPEAVCDLQLLRHLGKEV